MIAAGVAACAGPADRRVSNAAPGMQALPALEQPIAWAGGGNLEMVLADRRWPAFEQAREHPVGTVADGTPLFLHLRTRDPLGQVAFPAQPDDRYAFSTWPHLRLQVRIAGRPAPRSTCYLTLAPEDVSAYELVVPLAPATIRPGGNPADCWLDASVKAATGESRSAGKLDVRLIGYIGRRDAWLPRGDLLAVTRIDFAAGDGAPRYQALLADVDQRLARSNVEPAPAARFDGSALVKPDAAADVPAAQDPSAAPATPAASDSATTPAAPAASTTPAAPAAAVTSRTERDVAGLAPGGTSGPDTPADAADTPVDAADTPADAAGRVRQTSTPPPRPIDPAPQTSIDGAAPGAARFVIHYQAGDDTALLRARSLSERLDTAQGSTVELRAVPLMVSRDNIRVFFDEDRPRADAARRSLGETDVTLRDFSRYRPLPRPGTIEVWLAGTSTAAPAPDDQRTSAEVLSRR